MKLIGTGMMSAAIGNAFAEDKSLKQSSSQKPNVILIYTDDQTYDHFGVFGGEALTPNVDSLVADGMTFNRYYATSPVCTPSRFSTMTGQYASRSKKLQQKFPPGGMCNIRWNTSLVVGEKTMAHVLKSAGYTTGVVGKWHLGTSSFAALSDSDDISDPGIADKVLANYAAIQNWIKDNYGFDYAESIYQQNIVPKWVPNPLRYHNMDWITKGALDFIEQNQDGPFFLYMPTTLPHESLNATTEIDPLESFHSDPRTTPLGLLPEPLNVQPSRADVLSRVTASGFSEHSAIYTWIDDGVGAVLQKLSDLGIEDNTVVIFASDHGVRGKFTCYETGTREPCIIKWPGTITPGSTCDKIVANIDLAPTIFDICGATPLSEMTLDGKSMLPLLTGQPVSWRDAFLLEMAYTRAVVTDEWKYLAVRFPDSIQDLIDAGDRTDYAQDGRYQDVKFNADQDFPGYFDDDQLYNLTDDYLEQTNLAYDGDYAGTLEMMQTLMRLLSRGLPHTFKELSEIDTTTGCKYSSYYR